ncbi:hypothetical protein [Pseudomonas yamanorum]
MSSTINDDLFANPRIVQGDLSVRLQIRGVTKKTTRAGVLASVIA